MVRYGGPAPSNDPAVVEKARQTNLERWGVEWTSLHPEVRKKQLETEFSRYGGHFMTSEEGKLQFRAALKAKYGVEYPSQIEGFWVKTVDTFLSRYGATHPLLLPEFLGKRRSTCQERYGVDSPLQNPEVYSKLTETVQLKYGVECVFQADSIKEKSRQSNIERYGTPFPGLRVSGPNLLEQFFGTLNPEVFYTGRGSFWRWLPKIGQHKNPDFIVPGPDSERPNLNVSKVIEVFGDYWHSVKFTNMANDEHEEELVSAYADVGLQCKVFWESEIKTTPEAVRAKVLAFLAV
jgi:hypothetical protein